MQARKIISMVALIGVLLHAGALVRHNGAMLTALLQYQAIVADLTEICHSAGASAGTSAELPYVPRPTGAEFGCPVCSGFAAAFALAAPELGRITPPQQDVFAPIAATAAAPTIAWRALPPARAPPVLA